MKKLFAPLLNSHMAMMVICCLAMVGGFFLLAGGNLEGSLFALVAPLALCLGMHLVMHKMMGKSCHGTEEASEKEAEPVKKLGHFTGPNSSTLQSDSKAE